MNNLDEIEAHRKALLHQMEALRSMKRGTVAEQFLKVRLKDHMEPALRGPYFVFVRKEKGKNRSQRLTSPEQVRQAREDVANYRLFEELATEFAQLTERLGELERAAADAGEAIKKKPKSHSKRARKSSGS